MKNSAHWSCSKDQEVINCFWIITLINSFSYFQNCVPTKCLFDGTVANGLHIVLTCSDDQQNQSYQTVHQYCYQIQENWWQDWKSKDTANIHLVGVSNTYCSFATWNNRILAIPSKVLIDNIDHENNNKKSLQIGIAVMLHMKEFLFMA